MQADFLYAQIAQDIADLIQAGTLPGGEKLPSVRRLSQDRQVSVSTVWLAYMHLEAQGLIQARPQSGFYVAHQDLLPEPRCVSNQTQPMTVSLDQFVSEILQSARQPGIMPLGLTSLSPDLLPIQALNRLMNRLSQHPHAHTYEQTQGNLALRRQIARRSLDARAVQAEDILITHGCMEALHLALRLVAEPGSIIAVETPTYYGLLQAIEGLGMQALEIPAHPSQGIDLQALELALKTYPIRALLSVPTFQNPMGFCMTLKQKQALLNLTSAYALPIIEDDIYGEFYAQTPPPTLYSLDSENRVILCSSFSKTLGPGYRVGWVLGGPRTSELIRLKRMSTLTTSTQPQMVIAEFMASGAYDRYLRKLRHQLAENMARASHLIAEYFPSGTRLSRPQGGFILWLELPVGYPAMALYQRALKAKISLAPGPMFTLNANFDHCLRLSINQAWSDELAQSLKTLGELCQ